MMRKFEKFYLNKRGSFRSHSCKMRLFTVIFKHCRGSAGEKNHKSNLTPCATAFFAPLILLSL